MKIFIFSLLIISTLVAICQGKIRCSNAHPCENGGTCKRSTCSCPPTYFGELCEFNSECHPKCTGDKVCVRNDDNKTVCDQARCSIAADIAFVLDFSGSIAKHEFQMMIDTVKNFINHFDVGPDRIQVSLFTFNDFISKRVIKLNDFKTKRTVLAEVEKYEREDPDGGTRTDEAIKFVRETIFTKANGDRPSISNIAMIFTDGLSNRPNLTKHEALKNKDTDIRMISVGIGDGVDVKELELIATSKGDVFLTNFTTMKSLCGVLLKKTCNVSFDPCNSKPCKNGGRCKHFLTGYICDCQHPYVGVNCEMVCDIRGDIMIAIDESGSISQTNFDKIINAVIFFIKTLNIANGNVRVGVITYALDVFVHYDLDSFDNKLDMLFVCDLLRYQYKGGPTFTHKALAYLERSSFTPQKGDRKKYPNYVLFFSDGRSHYPWKTKKSARALHDSDVSVYSIGVGQKIKEREIYDIASGPPKQHMILTSFIRLELAMKRIITRVCEDLKPLDPCIKCENKCKCLPGMVCCKGCCRDTVTLSS